MSRVSRKLEHIQHALATGQSGGHGLSDVAFIPNSLPDSDYGNLALDTMMGSLQLSSPIMINAMTGGSPQTTEINQRLAILAREKNLAMAVGSQMAAIKDATLADSYAIVRREHPDGLILANLGAEATPEQAKRAVAMIRADALQIHLNVMQELLMPEGDRNFHGYLANIEAIAKQSEVPVVVKEVGFGMARHTVKQLMEAGVTIIDIGGAGGTNFAKIENRRQPATLHLFEDWGLTTVQSLLEASVCNLTGTTLIASGGISTGLDIAKAIALGASVVGMAGAFLRLVQTEGLEQSFAFVDELHHQLRVAMTALGVDDVAKLKQVPLVITGETGEWADLRGIDRRAFAQRG